MRSNAASQQPSGLVRALGPIDATMIVIGSMIGSGIFITSAETSRLSGAPGWLLLAWALAGLLTITGALCCSELATMMPRAGGVYVFLRQPFGSPIGFLYGWALFLVIQTGTIAAVAIAFAKFLGVFVTAVSPDNYLVAPISLGGYAISLSTEQLVAVALIALLTWTNTRGLEVGKIVQNTFTFAKTAALAAVVVIGLSLGWKPNSAALSSAWWDSWANGWDPRVAQPGRGHRRLRSHTAVWQVDGRSAFRPDRLDKRDLYRQRSAGSGKKSCTRACRRVCRCGRTLPAGQCRLPGGAAISGNPACATKPRTRGDDERRLRLSRCHVHGRGHHDFHVRLRQRTDSRRSAGLLCHGARWLVLPKNCDHKSVSCSRGSARGAGHLDRPPGFAAH